MPTASSVTPTEAAAQPGVILPHKTLKILIIDDVQSIRDALRAYLCPSASALDMLNHLLQEGSAPRQDFWINEAEQGEEGVQMAYAALNSGKSYDVIFVDMLMPPGIGGVEVIRRIREFDKKVPIVVCTAIANEAPQMLADVNGGQLPTMLSKPITQTQNLPELVQTLVAQQGA